jgi:hypothetical protein
VISSVASTPTSASMDETEHSAAGPDASEPTPRTLRSTRGCGGPAMDPLTERCRVEIRLDVSVPRPGQRPALALDGGNWHVPMRPLDRPGRRHPAPLLDERDSAAALSLCARTTSRRPHRAPARMRFARIAAPRGYVLVPGGVCEP